MGKFRQQEVKQCVQDDLTSKKQISESNSHSSASICAPGKAGVCKVALRTLLMCKDEWALERLRAEENGWRRRKFQRQEKEHAKVQR